VDLGLFLSSILGLKRSRSGNDRANRPSSKPFGRGSCQSDAARGVPEKKEISHWMTIARGLLGTRPHLPEALQHVPKKAPFYLCNDKGTRGCSVKTPSLCDSILKGASQCILSQSSLALPSRLLGQRID